MKRVNLVSTNIRSTLKYVIIALLVGVCVNYFGNLSTKDKMDQYISDYKQFKTRADSAVRFADSLKTQITIETNEAREAELRAEIYAKDVKKLKMTTANLLSRRDSLMQETIIPKTVEDSLELVRSIIPLQDSIITSQNGTISNQENQITELTRALKNKDNAILLLTTSRDSLQKVIINIPPPPKNPNKLFGIPLPSRKASFVLGTVVGLATAVTIIK
jgi:hypothetical protein